MAGYEVHLQTFNARNLTAQSRKRVFFFGLRKGLASSWAGGFQRPRVPEVHLRAGDVLENEEELKLGISWNELESWEMKGRISSGN